MDRRAWLKLGWAGLLQSALVPGWTQEDSAIPLMTLVGTGVAGKKIELTDFLGKTVLVSFFSADCAMCSRELKLMREFYAANAQRKFVLLGVNIDAAKKDFDIYNQAVAMTVPLAQRFPIVWRNGPGHQDSFGPINRQPTYFVINPKNELVFKREGPFQPEDWDNLAKSLQQLN